MSEKTMLTKERIDFIRWYMAHNSAAIDRFSARGDQVAAKLAKFSLELLGEVQRLRGCLEAIGNGECCVHPADGMGLGDMADAYNLQASARAALKEDA